MSSLYKPLFENSNYLDEYPSEYSGLDNQRAQVPKIAPKLGHEYLANSVKYSCKERVSSVFMLQLDLYKDIFSYI